MGQPLEREYVRPQTSEGMHVLRHPVSKRVARTKGQIPATSAVWCEPPRSTTKLSGIEANQKTALHGKNVAAPGKVRFAQPAYRLDLEW